MKNKIIVIGAYFADLTFYTDNFPMDGETVKGEFKQGYGGKGSNETICIHKLENKNVHFISAIGTDVFGEEIEDYYNKNSISHFFHKSKEYPTGCAGIYVNSKGENQIIISEGAMKELTLDHIKEDLVKHLPNSSYLIMQSEEDFDSQLYILEYIKEAKPDIKVIYNPAPFRKDYEYEKIINLVDYLIVNETEHASLEELGITIPNNTKIIITKGGEGVLIENQIVSSEKVKVVDTTGAGDCWIGAFVCMLSENQHDMIECATFANKVAGISVTRRGTSQSFPTKKEIED